MSWRLEAAAEEAERMVAMLGRLDSKDGADCARIRAEALRDALAMIERDVAEAEAEAEEAAPEPPEPAEAAPPAARAPDAPAEEPPPATTAQPAPAPDAGPHYTPERRALIAELWGDLSVSAADLLNRVNALPGPRIASSASLYQGVRTRCGLPGSRAAYASQRAQPAPPPAEIDPLAGLSAEEIEEARGLLQGAGGGARKLVEWFGWDLDRAQAIAEALRATPQAAAA